MIAVLVAVAAALAASAAWVAVQIRRRNMHLWLPAFISGDWAGRRERRHGGDWQVVHVLFCVADHFEPGVAKPGIEVERRRVNQWIHEYPRLVAGFRDADGRPPRHTFFYPAEEYCAEHLDRLAELVSAGYGEVEVHLHHDGDTSEGLREKLLEFKDRLRRHGHLGAEGKTGEVRFAFVHGNWALDNSLPDGGWCGVNDELRVLRRCGCYADFTLPAAPSPAQTRRINSIYYATDDPTKPRSHDRGVEVRVGGAPTGDLMMIQGPLGLYWRGGGRGLLPRIENGDLGGRMPVGPRRIAAWMRLRVCVAGRPDWVFVKLHTHGCNERNWSLLFGPPLRGLHEHLRRWFNDGVRCRLHYVTAREMYNIVKAAERGLAGDPGTYRDLEIGPPPLQLAAGLAIQEKALR